MPKPTPSSNFENAVRDIVAHAALPALPFDERAAMLDRALALVGECDAGELNRAAAELIPALQAADPYSGGIAAMAVGAFVESGADPRPACTPLRLAVIRRMRDATRFARTWSAGDPGAGDGKVYIEGRDAQLGKVLVTPESIQAWASREPAGARAWSRLDDWFLPLMAIARFSEECHEQIRQDAELKQALDDLIAADWCICTGHGLGNTNAGVYVEQLMRGGGLPKFADELEAAPPRQRSSPPTTTDLFDDLAEFLCKYCDRPDVVIRAEMKFGPKRCTLKIIRHVRDPERLFDNSGDVEVQLPKDQLAVVRATADEYFALTRKWDRKQVNTTVSVYQDGSWSMGGSSRER